MLSLSKNETNFLYNHQNFGFKMVYLYSPFWRQLHNSKNWLLQYVGERLSFFCLWGGEIGNSKINAFSYLKIPSISQYFSNLSVPYKAQDAWSTKLFNSAFANFMCFELPAVYTSLEVISKMLCSYAFLCGNTIYSFQWFGILKDT